jgi:hypothetical protein
MITLRNVLLLHNLEVLILINFITFIVTNSSFFTIINQIYFVIIFIMVQLLLQMNDPYFNYTSVINTIITANMDSFIKGHPSFIITN